LQTVVVEAVAVAAVREHIVLLRADHARGEQCQQEQLEGPGSSFHQCSTIL
jgi:hypothetical protein